MKRVTFVRCTVVASILLATLLFIFVWPTPYAYHFTESNDVLRVNRLTQTVSVLRARGWEPIR